MLDTILIIYERILSSEIGAIFEETRGLRLQHLSVHDLRDQPYGGRLGEKGRCGIGVRRRSMALGECGIF